VKPESAPQDWKDLLDPKWKGRFGSLDPHVTATTLAWQVMVQERYGRDFLAQFGANRPKLYASTNAMSQAIVSGEIDLGITNSFGVIQMADTGAPMGGVIPEHTVLFGGNIAVFAKAPHPNAARLFCDFACSAEGQTIINVAGATIPTHPEASAPKAGTLAELGKTHKFTQPDYKKIIADTPKLLAEWEKDVK
jgi:iron(III) transport system substrate-binding protein